MRIVCRSVAALPPAAMTSSTIWMASSPLVPRIAAPRMASVSDHDLHETERLVLLDGAVHLR
jgi:hypothetical protein